MKNAIRLLAILCFCAVPVFGQSTTVSGTIVDANNQPFANGTYTISLYGNGLPLPYMWQGAVLFPGTVYSGALNGSGAFSGVSIQSNNYISPAGTAWTFTVCPAASAPCYSQNIIVTGTSLAVGGIITPPAIQVSAITSNQPAAYLDSEVSATRAGSLYFNLTDNTLHVCIALPCSSNWTSIQAMGSAVNSWNTRTGNVTPQSGDYSLSQITATYDPLLTLTVNALNFTNQQGNCFIASPLSGILGSPTCRPIANVDLPTTLTANTSGNAATANFASSAGSATTATTAGSLSGTPTNCGTNVAATGISASGNATGCFAANNTFASCFPTTTTISTTGASIGTCSVTTPTSGCPCAVWMSYSIFVSPTSGGTDTVIMWVTDNQDSNLYDTTQQRYSDSVRNGGQDGNLQDDRTVRG